MKTGLAHVCIESKDLEATEQFYRVLGLNRQFEFRNKQNELVGFYLAFGNGTYIEVIKNNNVRGEGVVRHFAMEVDCFSFFGNRPCPYSTALSRSRSCSLFFLHR